MKGQMMETKLAAVTMKNVTKKPLAPVVANDKVNLEIYKGEILALLGENGSGKTTLMNMLSGIYFPDEGQIFINGKEDGHPFPEGQPYDLAASAWCTSISS